MERDKDLITEGELLTVVSALLLKASKFVMSPEERTFLDTADHVLERETGTKVDVTTDILKSTALTIAGRIVLKLWKEGHRPPILRLLASQLDVTLPQQTGGGDRMNPLLLLATALNIEMAMMLKTKA